MSLPTPFTDLFIAGWNPNDNAPQMLVRVELTVPSALTLYWCISPVAGASPLVVNPGGYSWQPVILDGDPIHAPGGPLEPGPSLVVTGFRIANVRLIPQSSGTAADLFESYVVRGAVVTMWLWHAGISSFSVDAGQCYKGVIQSATIAPSEIAIRCQQRKDVNVTVPPSKVNKTTEPNAPESSLGIPKPLVYGRFENDGMDEPWRIPYPGTEPFAKLAQEDVGAAGLVIPGLLVDSGVGGADGRVLFADHAMKQIGNTLGQVNVKVAAGQALASLNGTAISADLLSDNSGLYLKDEKNLAYIGIPCIDVRLTGTAFPNTALSPRAAMEIFDETTFAIVKSDGGNSLLSLVVGNVGSPGQMVAAELVIGYRTSHTTSPAKVRYERPSSTGASSSDIALTAHTTALLGEAVVQRVPLAMVDLTGQTSWAAGIVSTDWNTGAGDILVFLSPPTAGHYIHPFFVGLVILYKPSQSIVTPPQGDNRAIRFGHGKWFTIGRFPGGVIPPGFYRLGPYAPAVYEAQGQFFTNCLGREDTTGDYTGTALELIERPMDIIQHLLEVYGGESAANIETAINRFGSFSRARSRNVSIEGNPITLGVHVGAETQLYPLLARIAQQAPGWLYLSRFDDKWHFIPWDRRAPVADFPRTIEAADILEDGILADAFSESLIVNDVSVGFAYDFFRNRSTHTANVSPSASDGGLASRGKRDQLLKIEISGAGQNNRLDLVRSAVTHAATLNAATYTPAQMMVELKRALTAMAVSGTAWNAGWGGTVIAAHNDKVDFAIGGTTYAATVAPGGWTVGEMAHQVQLAMRAAGDASADVRAGLGMYVLAGVNDALDFNDPLSKTVTIPPGYYRDGAHLAQTVTDLLNSQSSNWTCTYDTGTKKFTIGRSAGTANLLWLTGMNVARNCAALLGFSHDADDLALASYVGDYARTRGRVHIQSKLSLTMKSNSGANKANAVAVSIGWDQTADVASLNHEGTYSVQDETFALSEITEFSLLWQSGVNAATSVAHVLGFKVAVDDAALTRHLADRRRSDRETRCATSRANNGPKEPENIVGVDVRTTEVAINLRDTVVDLLAEGPVPLRIKTHRFPDLERGRIVPLGDLSSLVTKPPRYGAGAWTGKLFRAVEVAQHWGRTWHQEIVLIEEQSPLASTAVTAPDGISGATPAFITWADERVATEQVYVQKLQMEGVAEWTANGVLVSAATSGETLNSPDSAVLGLSDGGCVVLYREDLGGAGSIHLRANRFNSSGAKQWGATGVLVTTATISKTSLRVMSDSATGYYFAWADGSVPYIRRCNADGTFAWATVQCGTTLAVSGGNQHLLPDGSGGAYLAWTKYNSGLDNTSLYAQRITSAGALVWAAAGVTIGYAGDSQAVNNYRAAMCIESGSLVALLPVASTRIGIIATKRNPATGAATWTTANLHIAMTLAEDENLLIVPSTGGNMFLVCEDRRATDNLAQVLLINSSGVVQWGPITINTLPVNSSQTMRAIEDGSGNLLVMILSEDSTTLSVLKVNSDGTLPWGAIKTVATVTNIDHPGYSMVSDGVGGAIVFFREDATADVIRAARVRSTGAIEWASNGVALTSGLTGSRFPSNGSFVEA